MQKRQVGDEKADHVSRMGSAHAAVYSSLVRYSMWAALALSAIVTAARSSLSMLQTTTPLTVGMGTTQAQISL